MVLYCFKYLIVYVYAHLLHSDYISCQSDIFVIKEKKLLKKLYAIILVLSIINI